MDAVTLDNGLIRATIKAHGAELCSLRDPRGHEMLWQAGPEWPRHAPILFPIVGRLKGDVLRHDGRSYPMTQHGFARDMPFAWVEQGASSCTLTLEDSPATRSRYPFAFRLSVSYALENRTLMIRYDVSNTGDGMLPASIGAHPAFNWPLPGAADKTSHRIVFSDPEPAPVRRLMGGLLQPHAEPTPVRGQDLMLSPSLFDADAVIFDQLVSTSLRFEAPGASPIGFAWEGFRDLGIWSPPKGASFLCIEPWYGYASPADFDGDFSDKPGVMQLEPGKTRSFTQRISFA